MLGAHAALGAGSERTMVERAILALLETLTIRQGRYLQRLDHYNGEIGSEDALEDIVGALQGNVPAVLIQTASASYDSTSIARSRLKATIQVEILLISAHMRSRESRNVGDEASVNDPKSDPGIYQIIADVRSVLCSRPLGVQSAQMLVPVTEQVVIQTPQLSAWVMRYSIDYRFDQTVVAPGTVIESVLARHNLDDSAPVNPVAEGEATA